MITLFLAGSFLIALLLGIVMIPNILLVSYRKRLFDLPDPRKVHTCPVPRLGGISFLPAIVITFALIMGFRILHGIPVENLPLSRTLYEFLFYIVGAMLLYLTGVQDDLIGVGYRRKFLIQILAALLLVGCGDWIRSLGGLFGIYDLPAWLGIPLTVFLVVYITNAINLIDGIDGLASGLCCISLTMLTYMHIYVGQYIYAFLALATLGILIPFWCYNVFGNAQKGHKLFMGDTGSLTIGGIIAVFAIIIHKELLIPILCGIFLVENLSVILQVRYFKSGKKKGHLQRVFKRAPIHDHFRTTLAQLDPNCSYLFMKPNSVFHESKITVRFWIVTIVLAAITIITLKIR